MDVPDRSRVVGTAPHIVLVPLKGFDTAKERLAGSLDAPSRRSLAERLAIGVLDAVAGLDVVVVCADDRIATWARSRGAATLRPRAGSLNDDLTGADRILTGDGTTRLTVVPGDLARPRTIRPLLDGRLEDADPRTVLVVPDRRADGTNLLSIPTGAGFRFRFGPGSAAAHRSEAARLGLPVTVIDDPDLAWDVDLPDDLPGLPPGDVVPDDTL